MNDRREPMKMLDSGRPVLDMDAYDPGSSLSEEFCLVTSAQGEPPVGRMTRAKSATTLGWSRRRVLAKGCGAPSRS